MKLNVILNLVFQSAIASNPTLKKWSVLVDETPFLTVIGHGSCDIWKVLWPVSDDLNLLFVLQLLKFCRGEPVHDRYIFQNCFNYFWVRHWVHSR